LGAGELIRGVLFGPERFFQAVKAGQVSLRPFAVYVVASAVAGVGSGATLGLLLGASFWAWVLLFGLAGALLSPLWWFIEVRVTQRLARLVAGKGGLTETKQAVGYGMLPNMLAVVPFGSIPGSIWTLFARAKALRVLHQVSLGRAAVVAVTLQGMMLLGSVAFGALLRGFVLEAFKVPSGSMFPSIELGDHLFVAKSGYGAPSRGDVIVFEYRDPNPEAPRVDYVKRVIGVPGDELAFDSGAPIINGWPVPRCRMGNVNVGIEPLEPEAKQEYEIFVEFLSGKAYLVAIESGRNDGHQGPYQVPAGEFWAVGDNRNNSFDSRSWNGGRGAGVPFDRLKGQARWLWFPAERFGIDVSAGPVLPNSISQLALALANCLAKAPDLAHSTPPARK
jgi:signal peptidase I